MSGLAAVCTALELLEDALQEDFYDMIDVDITG